MLWLTAVPIVFVMARNGAERAQQSTTFPGDPRLRGGSLGPSTRTDTRSGGSSARPTKAPRHRAGERGSVPINSAGVEQLCRLPGVGRRAAERIVRHRDRFGAFDSLEDLEDVEGFNPDRVRRLSERATL
jgi:competence ComEA-like helix-hairpin-helix protein